MPGITPNITDLDRLILKAALNWGNRDATYVIKNRVNFWRPGQKLKTSQVLYRLKRLEKLACVERADTGYLVMLCWSVTDLGRTFVPAEVKS